MRVHHDYTFKNNRTINRKKQELSYSSLIADVVGLPPLRFLPPVRREKSADVSRFFVFGIDDNGTLLSIEIKYLIVSLGEAGKTKRGIILADIIELEKRLICRNMIKNIKRRPDQHFRSDLLAKIKNYRTSLHFRRTAFV